MECEGWNLFLMSGFARNSSVRNNNWSVMGNCSPMTS